MNDGRHSDNSRTPAPAAQRRPAAGVVVVAALFLLLLILALSVGVLYIVNTEMRLGQNDLENTLAYYGAEAAMEKMMVDVSALYVVGHSPTLAEVQALGAASYRPALPGITYPAYNFSAPTSGGVPVTQIRNVTSGPNEGLVAYVVPMTLDVTARRAWGAEVRMTRDIEVALIPVFQYGVFSDTDLSYSAGAAFDVGGRVHTNGNLFLASSAPSGLVLHSKIIALKEVIRTQLSNGVDNVSTGRNQPVYIPTAPNGCDGSMPACRNLQMTEGSKAGGPASADNPNWTSISTSTYHGLIINGKTGARSLNLPFVAPGLRPIELVRRPLPGESAGMLVYDARLYTVAQIRVLISDKSSDLPGSAGVRLANIAPYYNSSTSTFGGTNTAFAEGRSDVYEPGASAQDFIRPPNTAGLPARWPGACAPPQQANNSCWPLIDGFLLVQRRNADGSYTDVTMEWLNLGIARQNPNAILKLEKYRDYTGDGTLDVGAPDNNPEKFYPLNLYDPREGEWRDVSFSSDGADRTCAVGGIINLVELDVSNLRRWLGGTIGSTGTLTESTSQSGYILYFSDRRGERDPSGNATGAYGYEDIIDPVNANGAGGSPLNLITPNGVLDAPEDVNQNGILDTYGAVNIGEGFGVANGNPSQRVACKVPSNKDVADDFARKNRVSGARHALKLINGAAGNLPAKPDGGGGFTAASENPVYVQGNYNADSSGFGSTGVAAAIVADAVTLLSNNWNDLNSFKNPTRVSNAQNTRNATTTWYRMAVAAGKTMTFPQPTWPGAAQDFGTDGGLHNFLRYLENWSGQTLNYRGSLVSLYYSEYANGIFKCCSTVYSAPSRNYSFDTNFLDLSKMPPGTPRFRDINVLGFQQVFTSF